MKCKAYRGVQSGRFYRVQPCGKVEIQYRENGKWVHDKGLTAAKLNHWRKSGIVVRVYPEGHQTDETKIRERLEAIDRYNRNHLFTESLRFVPVHPNGLIVYDRFDFQTVKADVLTCRTYDGWSAEIGLANINKGLSLAAHMEPKKRVIERERLTLLAKLARLP